MDPNRSELYTLCLIKWRFIHRKMHLNKSTMKATLRRPQTSRIHFIFCSYVFLTSTSICYQRVGANQLDPVLPSPCLLKGSLVELLLRPRCHSAAWFSRPRVELNPPPAAGRCSGMWAWKEVRPRMRIIALLFIVLFISSSEDMPYCGHKVRAETQYWCRGRATEIIIVRLSFVKEQKHSSVWMERFHTGLNSREETRLQKEYLTL